MSEDFTPEDPLPALRAEIDQSVAMAPEFARWARGQYDAFIAQGFNESQALYLTAVTIKDNPGKAP